MILVLLGAGNHPWAMFLLSSRSCQLPSILRRSIRCLWQSAVRRVRAHVVALHTGPRSLLLLSLHIQTARTQAPDAAPHFRPMYSISCSQITALSCTNICMNMMRKARTGSAFMIITLQVPSPPPHVSSFDLPVPHYFALAAKFWDIQTAAEVERHKQVCPLNTTLNTLWTLVRA